MKLKKGDNVKILSGKDRGKTGVIVDRLRLTTEKITIDGLNVFKKRSKPTQTGRKGPDRRGVTPDGRFQGDVDLPELQVADPARRTYRRRPQGPLLQKV